MQIENLLTDARSIITLVSFLTFVGILLWTYVFHRSADFDEMARLPLDVDTEPTLTSGKENNRG
jgi:cytochrome c oxidase cbb3-type subunit 4